MYLVSLDVRMMYIMAIAASPSKTAKLSNVPDTSLWLKINKIVAMRKQGRNMKLNLNTVLIMI